MTNKAFISLGTNLGDRVKNINRAYSAIEKRVGEISLKSSLYVTPPWGFDSDEEFVNSVVLLSTGLDAINLLNVLKQIENDLGRKEKSVEGVYTNRLIDLDIIDFNGQIQTTEEIDLPHPRMHLRNFVIFPLEEIAPDWIHPKFKKPIQFYKKALKNGHTIDRI